MSDSLIDRIGFRLKFVDNMQDRRLLLEAREALGGAVPAAVEPSASVEPGGFRIPQGPSETRSEAFVRATGVKLLPWQRKWLNEAEL